jgi:O-antigen ligase
MGGMRTDALARLGGGGVRAWVLAAVVVAITVAALTSSGFGTLLFAGVAAIALAVCALSSPVFAAIVLLLITFVRLALSSNAFVSARPVLLVLALLIASTALWLDRTPTRVRGVGAVEWVMALYLMWSIFSMFAPHEYAPGDQLNPGSSFSVPSFIVNATVIPFVLYVVGRYTFERPAAVRLVLWTILLLAGYSAAMSIMQFTGPASLVWPRFIVEAPNWPGRAGGVFNHPVINGMVLTIGFAIAMMLMSQRDEPRWRKYVAFVIAVGCGYGIYLTYTRAAWLSALAVLIIGALLAKGFRTGFVAVLCFVLAVVGLNWSVFTSTDREAGGVASVSEVNDRLNIVQTALSAAAQKPIAGWGIGRFEAVNTFHHQQWSRDTPWINGYGIVSHQNELGILAELGLVGLALWVGVLVLLSYRLWVAYRTLPDGDLCGKPLAVTVIGALAILISTGLTVDYRLFDFPTAAIFLLVGIAVGWSDRHKMTQASAGSDADERAEAISA